jgi:hypothetical protein
VQKSAFRSPNTVAFVERFIQTLRQELLVILSSLVSGTWNHLCAIFGDYYHRLRAQQGKYTKLQAAKLKSRR